MEIVARFAVAASAIGLLAAGLAVLAFPLIQVQCWPSS